MMRRLLLIAAVSALALAKPELYREKEDFQYSRSSSDDGSKSGFYGAQRGNMGGNYERAHNMDGLAQHQLGTALRQVEGEVGDTTGIDKGRVYAGGSTRGIYGQGNFNLENLGGRNFQENRASADTSHSSFSNGFSEFGSLTAAQSAAQLAAQSAGYGYESHKSRSSGYSKGTTSAQLLEQQNREALENLQYGRHTAGGSAYSQSYDENSAYHQSNGMSSRNTYGATKSMVVPVRVVLRPGSTVNVPINAEVYDNTYKNTANDQNTINRDAEVFSNTGSNHMVVPKPTTSSKHYESQYKYHKEWEKHDTLPAATPLVIPGSSVPHNGELYHDSVVGSNAAAANEYHSSAAGFQNQLDYANSASNHQSRYQSGYKGLQSKTGGASSNSYGTDHSSDYSADLINNRNVDIASAPKTYQASYSYKKSWERQGDPYIITPVGGNAELQRLTAASNHNAGYRSHQYSHGEGVGCDCDEQGNVRVARSIDDQEDLGQQTQQVQSSDFEELGQRPLSQNIEDFGQQTQQVQSSDFEKLGQRPHTQNLDDFGQQTQQVQSSNFEDPRKRQLSQNSWQQAGYFQKPNSKLNKVEDLREHTHRYDFGDLTQQSQQTQSQNLEDLGQQAQHGWNNSDDLGQQIQNTDWYAEDLSKKPNGKVDSFGQQPRNAWHAEDLFKPEQQHTNSYLNNFGNLNSQIQHGDMGDVGDSPNVMQQTQNGWYEEDLFRPPQDKSDSHQHNRNIQGHKEDLSQQTQTNWNINDKLHQGRPQTKDIDQQVQSNWNTDYIFKQSQDQKEDVGQQTENNWDDITNTGQHTQNVWDDITNTGQQTQSVWYGEEMAHHTQNQWKPFETGTATEKPFGPHETNSQREPNTPSSIIQRKPAFNTVGSFKPVEKQYEQSFSDWDKFEGIFNGMGDPINDGKSHSRGTDEYSFQHSSQNWGKAHEESSRSVQSHREVQYQFTIKNSTETNIAHTTTSNQHPWEVTTKRYSTDNHQYRWLSSNKTNPTTPSVSRGRGDIDASDSYQAVIGDGTAPTALTPHIAIVQSKHFKTPAEIETLSLTKATEKPTTDKIDKSASFDTNSQAEDSLSVVGLNQQWLEEQKSHGQTFQATTQKISKPDTENNWHLRQQTQEQNDQQTQNWFINDKLHHNRAHTQDFGQQVVQDHWNTDYNFRQTQDQTEDLGQQVQTGWDSENLQQSQRHSEDLGQQIQTGWNPNEKFTQESDHQKQINDFYTEHHQLPKAQVETIKVESHTISAPPEITTKPPGFWKRVGGRVSSWFKS